MKMQPTYTSSKMPRIALFISLLFCIIGPSMARILDLRQETTPTAAPSSPTAISSSEASATGNSEAEVSVTAPPTGTDQPTAQSATSVEGAGATGAASSNSTTNATNTTSAANSTSTGSPDPPLDSENDPNGCHKESDATNPFCDPEEGATIHVNESYPIKWDSKLFNDSSNVQILVSHAFPDNETKNDDPIDNGKVVYNHTIESAAGQFVLNASSEWLENGNSTNLTLALVDPEAVDSKDRKYRSVTFFLSNTADNSTDGQKNNTGTGSSSGSKSKDVGEKVGIPIGTIAFVAILAIVAFLLWRRFRGRGAGGDYLSRKSLGQRTGSGLGAGARGHGRTESFHDEPTRGMELQDRGGGGGRGGAGGDNWDWGRDSVGSPTSPTGNVFRDELQRQKTGGRR